MHPPTEILSLLPTLVSFTLETLLFSAPWTCHAFSYILTTWDIFLSHIVCLSSVQFSCSVVSDSLQPHELQYARPPCPSPTHEVHSNSRPSSQWCHPAISSSVVPFLPPIPPSIRVFSNESTLCMRWPKYWSFSFSISSCNKRPGFISDVGTKSYDKPRQHIKKQRHYFAEKGLSSQSYGFSSSHVWMSELDHKESWVPKNWCFSTVVDSWECLGLQGDATSQSQRK